MQTYDVRDKELKALEAALMQLYVDTGSVVEVRDQYQSLSLANGTARR